MKIQVKSGDVFSKDFKKDIALIKKQIDKVSKEIKKLDELFIELESKESEEGIISIKDILPGIINNIKFILRNED